MTYSAIILAVAKAVGVPGALILAICTHESKLQNVIVTSDGNSSSYGICQVKLETAQMLGYKGNSEGLMKPKENARWAARYLKYQLKRYDNSWCKAAAAYNAGTFNESSKLPGKPRNLKYLKKIALHMNEDLRQRLSCDSDIIVSERRTNESD